MSGKTTHPINEVAMIIIIDSVVRRRNSCQILGLIHATGGALKCTKNNINAPSTTTNPTSSTAITRTDSHRGNHNSKTADKPTNSTNNINIATSLIVNIARRELFGKVADYGVIYDIILPQ